MSSNLTASAMKLNGIVTAGSKKASSLGFPTVNIPLGGAPLSGIYAGKVLVGEQEYLAALFADPVRELLEAHMLDFSGDLYGKEILIEVFEKIRDSKKFSTEPELQTAVQEDIAAVRNYFDR